MEEILKILPLAPSNFYMLLAGILIYHFAKFAIDRVKKYIKETEDTFDKHWKLLSEMGNCLNELKTISKVHQEKHDKNEEDIRELRYLVRYIRDEKTG